MDKKLEDIIKKSGNNLHLEVVQILENFGWQVDLSSYYYDDTTNKPREIDIVAQKKISIIDSWGEKTLDSFEVFLFIECKYFKNEVAFRLHPSDNKKGIIIAGFNFEELMYQSELERQHHYLNVDKVAKLYDAQQDDQNDLFNAITQPIKSLIFFKDRKSRKGLFYPVAVYNGIDGVYAVKKADLPNLQALNKEKTIIFGLNYSYRSVNDGQLKNQYFCVDFVHQDEFEKFLKFIDFEVETVRKSEAFRARRQSG